MTSVPENARVYRDDLELGRTPWTGVIESEMETVVLVVRAANYESERVRIRMNEDPIVDEDVELEAENPFGHTGTLGGER